MVQWELDSFYVKFKNLLHAEKDATLTLKSEAGRASISLSLDLGHVHSEHGQLPSSRNRNGPARQRRREKREAVRSEKLSAEKVELEDEASTEKVEDEPSTQNSNAEKATETKEAVQAKEPNILEKETTEQVKHPVKELDDEVCPDEVYQSQTKTFISVTTQTLEGGVTPRRTTTSGIDYYALTYDDPD